MYISLAESGANGFKKWSASHRPHSNDDDGNVARSDAIAVANLSPSERPHSPWLVPGMANTF